MPKTGQNPQKEKATKSNAAVLVCGVMGAWGTALFSDDTACDVRDSYRDLVGGGLEGAEATKRLLNEWSASLSDPDEFPVFWLALAATQWNCGRLEAQVLHQALNVIDNGLDIARWDSNSKDFTKRTVVLDKLRAQLASPQPAERRICKRFRDANDWQVGDLIAYRMQSGGFVILRTIGHHADKGGTCPICELLDWTGEQLPSSFESFDIRKSQRRGGCLGYADFRPHPDPVNPSGPCGYLYSGRAHYVYRPHADSAHGVEHLD